MTRHLKLVPPAPRGLSCEDKWVIWAILRQRAVRCEITATEATPRVAAVLAAEAAELRAMSERLLHSYGEQS